MVVYIEYYILCIKNGMFDNDTTFGVTTLAFLIRQYQYSIEHQAFHIDDLFSTFDEWGYMPGDSIDLNDLLSIAYESGTSDFYAPACTRNDLELVLTTTQSYSGSTSNSYDVNNFGASTDTSMYESSISVCEIGLYYYGKTNGKDVKENILLYQMYATEYLDYDVASLFSGIGGIVGIAQNVISIIFPLILVGISISLLRFEWIGYAPLPNFDETFEKQLDRHIRNYLYKHSDEIQDYLRIKPENSH